MSKKIVKLPKRKPIRFTCTVKLEGHEKSPTVFTLTAGQFKDRESALKYFSEIWNAVEAARERL